MSDKLKILVGMDTYYPLTDGVVNCMHNLLISYSDDIDATAFIPYTRNAPELPYKTIKYKSFHIPFTRDVDFGFPSCDRATLKKLMDMDFDLIHVHSPFGVMKALTKVAKKKNIPIVATFHTNYRMVFKKILLIKPLYEPYIRTLGKRYSRMNEMFAGTNATKAQLESFGYNKTCQIIPFGMNLDTQEDFHDMNEIAQQKFNIAPDENVFLFVGRMVRSKRVHFTIQALRKVKDSGRKFKFIICGKGNYESQIKSLIKKLGLENECIQLGYVSNRDLQLLYSRSSLFLFPSILDNFGLVKVEAAFFSTPCVMVRDSNAAYGTIDGHNALLIEDNEDDYAKKIIWAIDNPAQLKQISDNAKKELVFTWKESAVEYEKQYKRVVEMFKNKNNNTI